MSHYILAPLINVNDEEMVLIEWLKPAGARVRAGEAIAVIETTKSTADLEADREGVLTPLVDPGATVRVGERIAKLESGAMEESGALQEYGASAPTGADAPSPRPGEPGEAWTRRAQILAQRRGLDIQTLQLEPEDGERVTVADLERFLAGSAIESQGPALRPVQAGPERVLVIGGGGAGVQVLDVLARLPGQRAVGVLDDDPALKGTELLGVPVWGSIPDAPALLEAGRFDAVVISIGTSVDLRAAIFERLRADGVPFTNVIDPRAAVLAGVDMGVGN